jgi:isopenicillin N synthase-like dioxygenase
MIPRIDVSTLFESRQGAASTAAADRAIFEAAFNVGFMTITGVPRPERVGSEIRESMLRLFGIAEAEQRKLWKKNFAPENANLYRGWFPLASDAPRSREGFEIGPDLVRPLPDDVSDDLLYESSVFAPDELLPGWRKDTAAYYEGMEEIGYAILASLSRSMGISERFFRDVFHDGISTLRLLHYPARSLAHSKNPDLERYFTTWQGQRVEHVCLPHVDSGLVTILAQDGVSGLQAADAGGLWHDVPPVKGAFAVNFGGLLSRWTGGRVRATVHRVLSSGEERYSVPFFFEPRPNAVIEPLPLAGVSPFEPFQFGDYLWATTTKFPENFGLAHLRPSRAPYTDPFGESTSGV